MIYVLPQLFMVFDCESVGLHGETFAVGWCLIDRKGNRLSEGYEACDPNSATAENDADREWVAKNVPIPYEGYGWALPEEVRESFWEAWLKAKERGAILVADCAWPVEARFLIQCVNDFHSERCWSGPYPLHDLASISFAACLDPLGIEERLPEELPVHDPLADARQSARLLIKALDRLHPAKGQG